MAFLRRLNFFLRGHRRYMAASVLFGLAFAASGLVPPLLIRQILIAHAEGTAASVALPAIVGVLAVTYLGRGGARYIYGVLAHLVGYRTQVAVLTELYRHIQTLPQKFFTDRRLGGLVSRLGGRRRGDRGLRRSRDHRHHIGDRHTDLDARGAGRDQLAADARRPHSDSDHPGARALPVAAPSPHVVGCARRKWPR